MHLKPSQEDQGQISKAFLKKLTRTDFKTYYSTPHLNDILYLHYKGFQKITNLQEFTGLKVVYLQGNCIKQISGLENQRQLRCLYLQQNLIKKIQNIDHLTDLTNLNLSDNMIEKVQGLAKLNKLQNLQLKGNRIGNDGLNDVTGLLQCQSISALDISNNKIDFTEFVEQIVAKMSNIAVIYMHSNGFNKKISHYRKVVITKIPTLKYIDDKPVFQDQRRFAEAWARGGLEQQRKQREIYKKQQQQAQIKQHQQFRQMIERHKKQAQKQKQQQSQSESQNESQSKDDQSYQTYKTPQQSCKQSQEPSQKSQKVESEREKSVNSEQKQIQDKYLDELD